MSRARKKWHFRCKVCINDAPRDAEKSWQKNRLLIAPARSVVDHHCTYAHPGSGSVSPLSDWSNQTLTGAVFKLKVVFYWDQPFQVGWVGWVVSCSIGKKPFSVGLVAQLFQPASNWVGTVEKALVAAAVVFAGSKNCYACHVYPVDPRTGRLHSSLVMTIPRIDRVSTENGWKSVLSENVNCVNLNQFRLKRLIPMEHDLNLPSPLKPFFQMQLHDPLVLRHVACWWHSSFAIKPYLILFSKCKSLLLPTFLR